MYLTPAQIKGRSNENHQWNQRYSREISRFLFYDNQNKNPQHNAG